MKRKKNYFCRLNEKTHYSNNKTQKNQKLK
jgi:hypothetical protein